MKSAGRASLILTCFLAGGCASVVKGSTQSIAISTPPTTGAACELSNGQGYLMVMSPGVATVEKSKNDIQIRCSKPGWQDAASTIPPNFQGWTVGNLFLGGLIGLGVDAATGAINEYPSAFQLPMVQAAWLPPAPAVGTPMALVAPQPMPAVFPPQPPSPVPPPLSSPSAGAAVASSSTGPAIVPQPAIHPPASSPGRLVLFPVTIQNEYHPSWVVPVAGQ